MSDPIRDRVCVLIDALQCAPMSAEALCEEAGLCRQAVDHWLHAFEARGLAEPVGPAAKPATGRQAVLWRWKVAA